MSWSGCFGTSRVIPLCVWNSCNLRWSGGLPCLRMPFRVSDWKSQPDFVNETWCRSWWSTWSRPDVSTSRSVTVRRPEQQRTWWLRWGAGHVRGNLDNVNVDFWLESGACSFCYLLIIQCSQNVYRVELASILYFKCLFFLSQTMLQVSWSVRTLLSPWTICAPGPGLLRVSWRNVVLPGGNPSDPQPHSCRGVLRWLWQHEHRSQ